VVFCGILVISRQIGDKFQLLDQIFGGAQNPYLLFRFVKIIIVAKIGGPVAPFPP
jgi:hypothetical protein